MSRRDLLVALPLLLLGLWALRNVAVAPLVGLPIAALAAALVLVTAVFTVRAAEQPSFAYDGDPVAAMGTVRRDGLLGRRLLTTHVDAGYVILQSWPRQRVFIDDRYDMYPRPVIDDDLILTRARPGWAAVLARGTSR